jgi:hypothetical protein
MKQGGRHCQLHPRFHRRPKPTSGGGRSSILLFDQVMWHLSNKAPYRQQWVIRMMLFDFMLSICNVQPWLSGERCCCCCHNVLAALLETFCADSSPPLQGFSFHP